MKTFAFFRRLFLTLACSLSLPAAAKGLALPTAAQIKTAFDAMDTSRNGAISMEEWNKGSFALFRAADKNNDDYIDRDELKNSNLAPDTFLRADVDHDERLNVSEFSEHRRAIFATADIDRDDYLSPVEFELLVLMERVGWLDTNQNGRIEISELTSSLLVAFSGLDTDADTGLDPEEAAYMRPEAFKRFDTNRDGKLSREEFIQGYRSEMLAG